MLTVHIVEVIVECNGKMVTYLDLVVFTGINVIFVTIYADDSCVNFLTLYFSGYVCCGVTNHLIYGFAVR